MADYGNYTTYHFDDVDEMSDYESTGVPPPPPPEDDYGIPHASTASLKRAVDELPKDLESTDDEGYHRQFEYDTLNQTTATTPDDDAAEDGSVEIPPTKVVEDMMRREQEAEKDKGGKKVVFLSAVLCILLSLAIILGAGFGTGTFNGSKGTGTQAQQDAIIGEGYKPNALPGDEEESQLIEDDDLEEEVRDDPAEVAEETTRGESMRDYLSDISLGGSETFVDLSSPESLALQWLVLEDPLHLDPTNEAQQFQITQRYALVALWYNSDFTWANETNWLKGHECGWHGISCIHLTSPSDADAEVSKTEEAGVQVVTSINLEGNNVQGQIPSDLALLTSIQSLNLADNVVEGTIPASLVQMTSLKELLLDRNLFSQDLSSYDFSPLSTSLQLLDLSSNGFLGTLPVSFWELTSLELLVLDNNGFNGPLSEDISQLTQLTRLTAGNNRLVSTLPQSLSNLGNLEVLWLFKNQLSGPLLSDWADSLLVLDVYDNDMTGIIPTGISMLPSLQQLVLGGNRFRGAIPAEIGQSMTQLTVLNLEACDLSGSPLPSFLGNLGNLTVLRLGNNPNMDSMELPQFLFQALQQLEELRLPGLGMTGNLNAQNWGNLRRLRIADLSDNGFSNFPQDIALCKDLEELNLSNNFGLGGNLPDDLDALIKLRYLLVASSGLMGNLTNAIGNLPVLEFLDLSNNTLLGTLPDFGSWINARELNFGTNFFDGVIPLSVGQLQNLQVLDLSVNFFRGEIPEEVGDMSSLVTLKLGDNANEEPLSGFSGTLPSALSNNMNLEKFECFSNRLTGTLPPEWGELDKLQLLDLEFNPVTGLVPSEWAGMTSMKELYISNTEIEGSIPQEICLPSLEFLVVDCHVTCTCCSSCEE